MLRGQLSDEVFRRLLADENAATMISHGGLQTAA
jgi:Flp pilus assembly pilin Flp